MRKDLPPATIDRMARGVVSFRQLGASRRPRSRIAAGRSGPGRRWSPNGCCSLATCARICRAVPGAGGMLRPVAGAAERPLASPRQHPGAGGAPSGRAGHRPHRRPARRVTAAFRGRTTGTEHRPPRACAPRVRPRHRRGGRVAVWRALRPAAARALRSAHRSDQCLRSAGSGRRRRFHREARRPGVDRHAARAVRRGARRAVGRDDRGGVVRLEEHRARRADPAQRAGRRLHRAVPGAPARLVRGRAPARRALPADDPGRVPRRGAPARPGLRAAHRKRVQPECRVPRPGPGGVAVHGRHGQRTRPQTRLVHRRALGPREGHPRRRRLPADAGGRVRWRLAPRAGVLQRRAQSRAPRDEAVRLVGFLGSGREAAGLPAAGNA